MKIKDIVRRYGIVGLLMRTINKLASLLGIDFEVWDLYVYDLNSRPIVVYYNSIKLSYNDFVTASFNDKGWFTKEKMDWLYYLLNNKDISAYGMFDNDTLISYALISSVEIHGLEVKLDNMDMYTFDHYTHPYYRGKGLHRKILNDLCLLSFTSFKRKRLIGKVAWYNKASKVGFEKVGFSRLERFIEYRFNNKLTTSIKYGKYK